MRTRDDFERFDDLCIEYGRRVGILVTDCPALRLLYDKLTSEPQDIIRTLLPLAFDIKLASIHTFYDISTVAGIENRHLVPPEARARFRPLKDVDSFVIAFRRYRAAFGLTTRIRSIWDKIFIYIGIEAEGLDFLRQIQNAKSKRKFFLRRFGAGTGVLRSEDVEKIRDNLDRLESTFRTPELHGFGSIRTWAFATQEEWPVNEVTSLMGHWNVMNQYKSLIFRNVSTRRDSFGSRTEQAAEGDAVNRAP